MSAKLRLKGPIHLACSDTECWKCKRSTPVFAIEASDLKDLEDGDASQPVGEPVFVHDIAGKLPASLQAGLTAHAPNYLPTFSRTAVSGTTGPRPVWGVRGRLEAAGGRQVEPCQRCADRSDPEPSDARQGRSSAGRDAGDRCYGDRDRQRCSQGAGCVGWRTLLAHGRSWLLGGQPPCRGVELVDIAQGVQMTILSTSSRLIWSVRRS